MGGQKSGDGTVVAIDGPSGAGKSTVARELARRHGWRLVDTGAMYRALTWAALDRSLDPDTDAHELAQLAKELPLALGTTPDDQSVHVGSVDVTRAIRTPEVTAAVSAVSAVPEVRTEMVRRQRELAASGDVVVEGRDIGTTVLPDADLKVFLTASESERAARRAGETGQLSHDVASALALRDRLDSSRQVSPLQQAPDAFVIDSSRLDIEGVVAAVETELSRRKAGAPAEPATLGWTPRWSLSMRLVRAIARVVVRLVLRVRLVGAEHLPSGPALIAGNHTGFLDGPLVYILLERPSCFLAKSELFDGPWASVLRWVNQIPVHRGEPDRAALHAAIDALRHGEIVGMFPEGTRGEGKLETIQDGVGYIAAMSGVPVVPVVCRGTERALPRGRMLPRWRSRIDIVFGEAFTVGAAPPLRREQIRAAATEIAARLRALVDEVGLE